MKAMVLRELAGPLRLTEVPIPVPGPGEVRVRVRATGVGLTVVIMTANPGLVTSFPRIPGHEGREEARIGPGDRVLIVGAGGGVGIHAVQVAKLCGGWVIGADVTDAKLDMVRAAGADETIDSRGEELSKQVLARTGGRGVEAAIDFVSSSETLQA